MNHEDTYIVVKRELEMQRKLSSKPQVLNIPCVLGPVGVGKTALARDFANEYDLPLITINVGENSDPTDVSGIPVPTIATDTSEFVHNAKYIDWVLNKIAALACDKPVFLLVDDIDKGAMQVVAALLSVFGNRMFRDQKIHDLTLIMAAGNRIGDDAHANQLSESLRTRVTCIELDPSYPHFAKWGSESGEIHPAVLGFLAYKPDQLHGVGKESAGVALREPTPRGWWEASQQMFVYDDPRERVAGKPNWQGIVERKCGKAVGSDFNAWFEILQSIKLDEIFATGKLVGRPNDKDEQRRWAFALVFRLASELNKGVDKKQIDGLNAIFDALSPELLLALAVQLPSTTRGKISKMSADLGAKMNAAVLPESMRMTK